MTARGRWIVRVAMIAFAVLLAAVFGVTAVGTTAQVASAADHVTRRALTLAAAGAWLQAVGFVGLYVSQAVRFRDWSTFALPFAPAFGRLGSRRGLRRATRQIDGFEPYAPHEVARLRSIARFRVSLVAAGSDPATRAGSVSLLLSFTGMVLRPPVLGSATGPESVLGRSLQVLAAVMVVVLLASLASRKRVDDKAEAFLDETSGAGAPPDASPS